MKQELPAYPGYKQFIEALRQNLQSTELRAVVVLHYESDHQLQALIEYHQVAGSLNGLVISDALDGMVTQKNASSLLGDEYALLIYDARHGINPDVLGKISGALVAQGLLLLVLPEKQQWDRSPSLYTQFINTQLDSHNIFYFPENDFTEHRPFLDEPERVAVDHQQLAPYRTTDQKNAVKQLSDVYSNPASACYVLTSGRGRGKTSALGFVAASILRRDQAKVLLTAPRLSSTQSLFRFLEVQLPEAEHTASRVTHDESSLSFIAPDLLLETLPDADVLMVDEAAAIPISMLQQLLAHYPGIIFSTTTHGYEGTGRGFILKFQKLLDEVKPGWQKIELHEPIRWHQGDPVERWIEQLLFLDLRLGATPTLTSDVSKYVVQLADRKQLIKDEAMRASIFSLLVYAHYRTSPADFQYLLESNDVRLYTLEYQQQLLGVCLVNQEGGFDAELTEAIYRGERRPKGNLLAQTLCFHSGDNTAASLSYSRVMRIAVHPMVQSKGLGSQLLDAVIGEESQQGIDVVGSSFSANVDLLRFWQQAGMRLLRMGFSRDHVTATHSAVVAMPLSEQGRQLVERLEKKFWRNMSYWLSGPLKDLSADMQAFITQQQPGCDAQFSAQDRSDVYSYVYYHRNYEACYPAIMRLIQQLDKANIDEQDIEVLNSCQQYAADWKAITQRLKTTGRAQSEQRVKQVLKKLL